MTYQRGEHSQLLCSFGPNGSEAECLRRQDDGFRWVAFLVCLVCASGYSKLFSCPFLFPSHASAPDFQFETGHIGSSSIEFKVSEAQHLRVCSVFYREYIAKYALLREFCVSLRAIALRFSHRSANG